MNLQLLQFWNDLILRAWEILKWVFIRAMFIKHQTVNGLS